MADLRPTGRAWLVLGLLWVSALSYYTTRNLLVTMHGSVEAAIPMTETQFGLLTSVFLWVYACLNPIGGILADRFSRSAVIIVSLLAWSAVTWLTGLARTFPQLLALRAVMGVSQACYMPAASALVTEYHTGPTRSFATGVHMTGLVVGALLGSLSGWVAELRDWTYAFSLVGLPSIAFGILVMFVLRDPPEEVAERASVSQQTPGSERNAGAFRYTWITVLGLLRDGSVMAVVAISALQNAVSWLLIGWMPTYLHERFKLGQGAAGFSSMVYVYVTQFACLLLSGVWSDRWSRRQMRARVWVPAIGLFVAAPGFWLAGRSGQISSTYFSLCLWGMAVGFMGSNVMTVLCLLTNRKSRATAYGIVNGAGAAAGGLAVYGAGALRDLNVDLSQMLAAAGVCAALCAVFFLLIRTDRAQMA